MSTDFAYPQLDPIESKDATGYSADYVRQRERAAIEADRRLHGRQINPLTLKTVSEALAFYADEKAFDKFAIQVIDDFFADPKTSLQDQQTGSSLSSDRGDRAHKALVLLRSVLTTA